MKLRENELKWSCPHIASNLFSEQFLEQVQLLKMLSVEQNRLVLPCLQELQTAYSVLQCE